MADRVHDIVVFGATGFAGRLTAEYLARQRRSGCRWALAGRNQAKLEAARGLAEIDPASPTALLRPTSADVGSVRAIAESTRVVITTVGPYVLYGEASSTPAPRRGPTTST